LHYLGIILASITAYLIGSISWSIIIVRWRRGIDVRSVGSKNAGATNTTRLLGKKWGLITALLDGFKVVVAALIAVLFSLIPSSLFSETSYFIPAVFVLIGHCWPIYYKFKGGKAVSCFLGLIFISNVWYLFIFLIVWFIAAGFSRKVSVSSIIGAIVVGLIIWLPWLNGLSSFAWRWNSYDVWVQEAWSSVWLRFAWMNYLHMPIAEHVTHLKGFASGMLEIQIVNLIGGVILLVRHWPNFSRIAKHEEPQTFPKLTAQEKAKLRYLHNQPRITAEERKEIQRLEKIDKLSQKALKIQEKIDKLDQQKPPKD